ncbi:MAG: hypothetical protein ACFFC7_26730 [Candidatus Hermodarchaeota archaeon]
MASLAKDDRAVVWYVNCRCCDPTIVVCLNTSEFGELECPRGEPTRKGTQQRNQVLRGMIFTLFGNSQCNSTCSWTNFF